MKIFFFLFKIMSLLPINYHELNMKNTILVSEVTTQLSNTIQNIDEKKQERIWIHFRSSNKFEQKFDNLVTIDLPSLFKESVVENIDNHNIDQYKFNIFNSHKFSKYITYNEFCQLENIIAKIVQNYIDDSTKSYGIVIDEIFLQTDSILYKFNGDKKTITTILTKKYSNQYPNFILIDPISIEFNNI